MRIQPTPTETGGRRGLALGLGIALGIALGAAVGAAMKNVAMGVALGAAFGTAAGALLSPRSKPDDWAGRQPGGSRAPISGSRAATGDGRPSNRPR